MAELLAQGKNERDQWRRRLPEDQPVLLGRDVGDWSVTWDQFISRRHAEVVWTGGRLKVQRLPRARNPVFLRGEEANAFELPPGELFVIGETTFRVIEEKAASGPVSTLQEVSISAPELQRIPVRDAAHQLDVLSQLPGVISGAASDAELFDRLSKMLLAGVRRADAVALVAVEDADPDHPRVHVLHWERRAPAAGGFEPSHRLVLEAVVRRRQTVVHAWGGDAPKDLDYTVATNLDWAFCTPVPGDACKNWGLYLGGGFTGDPANYLSPWENNELGDELKFIELVAQVLNSLRQVQVLQRRQDSLSHFFSPAVLRALRDTPAEIALKPREAEVAVLFCDVRGFSRQAEMGSDDLIALLARVSKALGVMTQTILDQGGVIGDFHGDAAMGFWGWPLAQDDKVPRASMAALGIRQQFEASAQRPDHPLKGFHVGIGLATGRAVAGQIGTTDQVKITAFGPVVNLAARLEGMTKLLRAPILLDEATAGVLRAQLAPAVARCRRLIRVQPYGLDTPLEVSELLPPAAEYPLLSDAHLATYEQALDAFLAGDWNTAFELLHQVPPQDRGKDFLLGYIIQHNHTPPPHWDGVILLDSKG
jgi:adenylate cyclase